MRIFARLVKSELFVGFLLALASLSGVAGALWLRHSTGRVEAFWILVAIGATIYLLLYRNIEGGIIVSVILLLGALFVFSGKVKSVPIGFGIIGAYEGLMLGFVLMFLLEWVSSRRNI